MYSQIKAEIFISIFRVQSFSYGWRFRTRLPI